MNVPTSVTFIAERLQKEMFCSEAVRPDMKTDIRRHSDPKQGWIVEITLKPPHDGKMLPLLPTVRRLGGGSVSWDLERNAIIITGIVNDIIVSVFISREVERTVRMSRN